MGVRDDSRANCLVDKSFLVVCEIGAEQRDTHRRSVAHGPKPAERGRCRRAPVQPTIHVLEDLNCPGTIAARRIGGEASREGSHEAILLDGVVAP